MAKAKLDLDALHKLGEGAALSAPNNVSEPGRHRHPGGRPTKEKKASKVFNINFLEEDFEALKINAAVFGMPTATYIKMLISQGGGFDVK